MSDPDAKANLDPAVLDPEAMDPGAYHAVVGPALQVASEAAASRGHPSLHADMPAMLALIDLVAALATRWQARFGADRELREALDNAPTAACVMVLQRARLDDTAVGQCLAALETAHTQLIEHGVTKMATARIDAGWRALQERRRPAALAEFKAAAKEIVAAIEAWQAKVH